MISPPLLMTRLYQGLLVGESARPQALLAAQLWLRDLSDDEERRFRRPQVCSWLSADDRRARCAHEAELVAAAFRPDSNPGGAGSVTPYSRRPWGS